LEDISFYTNQVHAWYGRFCTQSQDVDVTPVHGLELENAGTLEAAQRIAGHADSRTTKLYDRRGQKVLLEDMEGIRYKLCLKAVCTAKE
jgi:hypothetical protein